MFVWNWLKNCSAPRKLYDVLIHLIILFQPESLETFDDQKCVFEIELEKDDSGLGLTVAGYICEKGI